MKPILSLVCFLAVAIVRIFAVILLIGIASQASADDLLKIPAYDGALLWGASIDRLLLQIAEDIRTLIVPVEGRVSSKFGMRLHPLLGITRHHDGIDIACRVGTPVRAVLSGIVGFAGKDGGYGSMIEIRHEGEAMKTRYGHLSKMVVKKGERVKRGEVVGYSGNSDLSTGPHLHFGLSHEGHTVDPERYLGKQKVPVKISQKSA